MRRIERAANSSSFEVVLDVSPSSALNTCLEQGPKFALINTRKVLGITVAADANSNLVRQAAERMMHFRVTGLWYLTDRRVSRTGSQTEKA